MTDTQAQEAARLADAFERSANWLLKGELIAGERAYPLSGASDFQSAAALLRSQAARIAELESRVHTCGPTCSKAGCINRRLTAERDALRAELARMREPLSDEQIDALRVDSAKAMQALAGRGLIPAPEVCDEDLVRRVEAAHGITKTGGGV